MTIPSVVPQNMIGVPRVASSSTQVLNGTVTKQAYRFIAPRDMVIVAANVDLSKTGSPGSVTLRIQTESAGLPSGTDFTNGFTNAFTPSATGQTGDQNMQGNVSISQGTVFWLVLEETAGTHDGSNNWTWRLINDAVSNPVYCQQALFQSAAWGTLNTSRVGACSLKLSDGTYWGQPNYFISNTARTIGGTTRVGIAFMLPGPVVLEQIYLNNLQATGSGSLGNLEFKLFADADNSQWGTGLANGGTGILTPTQFVGNASITTGGAVYFDWGGSIALPGGKFWLSLHQAGDTNTNQWRIITNAFNFPEAQSRGGTSWQVATRTNDTNAWTPTNEDSVIGVIYSSLGGIVMHPGMCGRMN